MKTILKILSVALIILSINFQPLSGTNQNIQSSFCEGFKKGYKDGYCYKKYGCTPPVPPPCPVPGVTENGYKDGYNRGFIKGLHAN